MPEDPGSSTQTAGGTQVLEETRQAPSSGDEERFAHYVRKERIMESAVVGGPVVALCGKIWTPSRDPEKYPICPICKDIYEQMKNGSSAWPFGSGVPGEGGAQ
ncbi:MAG: DUF3039 domain-containing protein [Actinomycetaceae bacterium]|nr:DUF3039 domain-containing protein [Actinomycetaceae bacterium]MDY6083358.1 DUF3039 domain-containing protein [Actinomycetaceae bacterium]